MHDPSRSVKTAGAISTSIAFHVGLLVVFAAIRWGVLPQTQVDTIAAGFTTQEPVETIAELPEIVEQPTETAGGIDSALHVSTVPVVPLTVTTVVEPKRVSQVEIQEAARPAKVVAATTSKGNGVGQSSGNGDGEGGSFFDTAAEGDRVVYVVDCSRSMNRPYPSPEKTRFGRVKRELIKSIRSLKSDQKFFVIYFNTDAHPMPAQKMVPRSSYLLMDYLRWLASFETDGRTNPEPALLLALRLKPDAVFFLTDGDFRAHIVDNIVEANVLKTPVHAVGFGDEVQNDSNDATKRLGDLASRTGGRLTLINDDGRVMRK